jgi:Fe-S oxidoreductase
MDAFVLDYTRQSAALTAMRNTFMEGDPGALLCVELYADDAADLPPRLHALEADLRANGCGYRYVHALDLATQARIWGLREAALGLSMAMKDDAKSLSFVEDTAVPPERLRDYIARFLEIVRAHGTRAGVYAHASVGCLHVRPVVNLKTEDGVQKFEALASDIADLVLEFGGALSGEHGDGLVRSPFMRKMFGPVIYEAFRAIKQTFDPAGLLNPGKIVDAGPMTANLRFGAGYVTPRPDTAFDYAEYGGFGGAVEMCSGVGACRKTLEGTMCPSYMATHDEQHTTRGRANVLRLAMAGRLGDSGLDDRGVYETLDLCLECRACKAECPVGVDMARYKSEFLFGYWQRHGTSIEARTLGNARSLARLGSAFAPLSNAVAGSALGRAVTEHIVGIDRRRRLPVFQRRTLERRVAREAGTTSGPLLFVDTFTNYYDPEIGEAALAVLAAAGTPATLARNGCCGRPQISKGLLDDARLLAKTNAERLYDDAVAGRPLVFCEPSGLSAVREDAPALLRGDARRKAEAVARVSVLFEEHAAGLADLPLAAGPARVLLHGHCHQRSMGLVPPSKALLARIPGVTLADAEAGCCGMAGSFGYGRDHYEVSKAIGERRLFPAVRARGEGTVVVAAGTSCRHQIHDFTGVEAVHPAVLLRSLLHPRPS